jgi:VIT1/CCC1 family predicted Fe2+/Mn2+ transporter
MAVGNYLSTKASRQVVERTRRLEEQHIEQIPEGEREEIRQIFAAKGFEGKILEEIVTVITNDRHRWIDTMITDEWGLPLESPRAWRAGLTTFAAFCLAGLVPLLPFFSSGNSAFGISAAATAVTFFLIGAFKGHVVHRPLFTSGFETLAVGSIAAAMAYLVGGWLRSLGVD